MKRIFLLFFLWIYPVVSFSAIDGCKTDVYFANGILTKDWQARANAELLEAAIKDDVYGDIQEYNKHIGKVWYAYNNTYEEKQDLFESGLQMFELHEYIDKLTQWLYASKNLITSHQHDLDKQVKQYKHSIEQGRRVLVVAHSQGNLFTTEAYRRLGTDSKNGWMQNYFEAVSIASPDFTDIIKKGTPEIGWDNDVVAWMGNGFSNADLKGCNVRQVKWNLAKSYILGQDTPVSKPNDKYVYRSEIDKIYEEWWVGEEDWKERLDSNVHAFTFYMGQPIKEGNKKASNFGHIYINPFDDKLLTDKNARIKIMSAISTKLNNGKSCPCSSKSSQQQPLTKNGAIEVTLSWTCGNNIDMDLLLSGPNVQVDVNDDDSSYLEHAYVASRSDIHSGDKFTALGRGEKRQESSLKESYLEDNPVNIYAVVKTPGGSKFKQYEARNFGQLNLGEFAVIEVKDKKIETTYTSSSYVPTAYTPTPIPNPRPYVRTYNECNEEDKKYTCQCVPCEYIVYGMENAVQYGPIGNADVEVMRADTYGSAAPKVVYRGKTTNESDLFKSGLIKFSQSDYTKFEDDVYYVVDAKGGSDLDRDDDLIKDSVPTANNGTIHAIIKGSDLKTVSFRVNALTEAIYQVSGDLLGASYDALKLEEKLAKAAQKLFREKTFIFNNELEINYHDVLLWTPGVDKKKLFKPYDTFVEPIVVKTYADQARAKESYRLIYEKLDTDAPQLTPLAVEIPHTIPNNSIIGKVNIASGGVSGIDHIELHGDANATFSIDKEGLVKVVDASALILDAIYKLDMIAVGADAKRSISMELVVKVIEGAPLADPNATVPTLQSVELFDIVENAAEGTLAGKVNFVDSSLNIVGYNISGEDNDSFIIDNSGQIIVVSGADIDYEKSDTYNIKVSAVNEAGNESFPVAFSIGIINEIDTPLHDLVYLTHLSENVPMGTVVGKIVQLREGRSPITSFDIFNPNVPFAIDVNGTIRTTGYINYEETTEYNLIAVAKTDSGNSSKVEIQIIITDVYPETGKPTIQPFTSNIDENASEGTHVGALNINQGASPVKLVELQGTGGSNFSVDVNGSITVASGATLDYEQKSDYVLQAIAHNAKGSSSLASVTISLNNIEDEPPVLLTFTQSIEENTTAGTVVGKLKVSSNGEGNITAFTLTGTGAENFTIDDNGIIRVSSSATLDYESLPSYSLLATVYSDAGESQPVSVRIYVLNVAEHVPVLKPFIGSLEENATVGTVIGTIEEDSGGDSPIVSYQLSDTRVFSIDANGTITLNTALDYEIQTDYTLEVTAINVVGQSIPATITINITNIIDDEPVLNEITFNVKEDTTVGTVLGSVEVNSTGTSAIESMTLSGIGAEKFSIDINGTVKLVQTVDYESKKVYHLQAIATNAKAESPQVSIEIAVGNVPEHVPVLYSFKGFVEDNATEGTVINTVAFASRGDSPVSGFVLEGTGKENFTIDTNGTIGVSATASLDETVQKSYTLQVSAVNVSGSSDSVEAVIILTYDKKIPYKPSMLKLLDIGHNSITLGWTDNAQNERGFNLYIDGVKHTTLSQDSTSYRVTGLEEETSYIFTLKSFNDRGESIGTSIEGITDIDRSEYLKAVLGQKCGVSESDFDRYFNVDTGHYGYYIWCGNRGMNDDDLLNFKALKNVRYGLYLDRNNFTNVDGLSNLKSVGYDLHLYNNQLTNVDGLNKLSSVGSNFRLDNNQLTNVNGLTNLTRVGSHFYLNNNKLTNVNGLSSLTSVGSYFYLYNNQLTNVDGLSSLTTVGNNFYLYTNQLTNIDGLSSLVKVGGNLHVETNYLTNLDGLMNLTNLGGYLAIRKNPDLIDISGAENIVGKYGKLLYIDPDQYATKADANSSLCSDTWDLRSPDENIEDDMSQVCEDQEPYVPEPKEKLRDILEAKCSVTNPDFYRYFNADTGHYNYYIWCGNRGLSDDDLQSFKALKSVQYGLYLDRNSFTNVDGLSNLKSVGYDLHLYNNQLINVDGLSSLATVGSSFRLDGNQLENVNGLNNLTSVGNHFYLNNNKLTNVNGLISLSSVGQYFYLQTNQLTNLDGLSSLATVGNNFYLYTNQLTNIDGLTSLVKVGGNLHFGSNQLNNLDSLAGLTNLGGYLAIKNNPGLIDISGAENIVGKYGKQLYIDTNQYSSKADTNSSFCSATWDLRNASNVNIPDDMSQVCEGQEPYVPESKEKLRDVLEAKCSVTNPDFYRYFNADTGHYNYYIWCGNRGLSDDDLQSFKALKSVQYGLYLDRNSFTNVDGLSNLKSVGYDLHLYNNQLINVDGLTNLTSVGSSLRLDGNQFSNVDGLSNLTNVGYHFYLNNNKLTNVHGLSSLTSVGSYFYLQTNQLTNLDGLSSLARVGSNFNVEGNQLTNLNGLSSITSLGGYLALRGNSSLTDISGVGNAQSSNGRLLYINPGQYTTRASEGSNFCSTVWDLRDPTGNIADDMTQVCDMNSTELTPEDKLRNVLGEKCAIDSSTFYNYFNADTGHYNYYIWCGSKGLTDEDLLNFKALKSVQYGFYLDNNNFANVDGLSNLKSVGYEFHLYNNQLINIDGLSSLTTVGSSFRLDGNQLENVNGLSTLTSVGYHFYLNNNKLTNVNGLSSLTNVGQYLYLQTNQLTNLDGLSSLTRVGSNLNVEGNQLSNLDGLTNLTSLGGYLALRGNANLTDISGVSNTEGSNGQILYINPGQYSVKADDNESFCSTTWDLKDPNGNIADDMTQVCDSVDPYAPTDIDNLREVLGLCSVDSSTFYNYFNADTGHYNYYIWCGGKGLTDEDILNFKALKSVQYGFYLDNNNFTNVDGLSNLKSVGYDFYLYNNQLTNVDGLNQLTNVGSSFRLDGNQLENVNGLSFLTSVGQYFYLQTNELTNLDGLSSLTKVGNNFNVESNQLTNLDGLIKLITLEGYLALRANPTLTDISGVSNIEGSNGQILYINQNQYEIKANENLKFCSNTWNLHDPTGDITDDMSLICDASAGLTDVQKLRAVMEAKCSVSFSQFANNFDEDTGVYTGSVDCSHKKMNNDELTKFTLLNQITGSLSINDNNLTKVDGLSNLISIGGYFYLQNNKIEDISGLGGLVSVDGNFDISNNSMFDVDMLSNLTTISGELKIYLNSNLSDIYGLSNIVGIDGKKIYIDSTEYSIKAALDGALCSAQWDIYSKTENIDDDMSKLCDGYNYEPTNTDRLRDLLGKRCDIDSTAFYSNFADDSGIYNGNIKCKELIDEEMIDFEGLLEVNGNFRIEDSNITNLDGLIRVKRVTGSVSISSNQNLSDIYGLSNIAGNSNQKLIIDDTDQYDIRADSSKNFCATSWDIYDDVTNIANDMGKVCDQ